jgi:hypothetical protein
MYFFFIVVHLFSYYAPAVISKTDLLTNGSQKSWSFYSMTPDERCSSIADDTWIFFANGTFEYSRGTVTADAANTCRDFVNVTGTWSFSNSETNISVTALQEKGNPSNVFSVIMLQGQITVLEDNRLVVVKTNPADNTQTNFEFRKK